MLPASSKEPIAPGQKHGSSRPGTIRMQALHLMWLAASPAHKTNQELAHLRPPALLVSVPPVGFLGSLLRSHEVTALSSTGREGKCSSRGLLACAPALGAHLLFLLLKTLFPYIPHGPLQHFCSGFCSRACHLNNTPDSLLPPALDSVFFTIL